MNSNTQPRDFNNTDNSYLCIIYGKRRYQGVLIFDTTDFYLVLFCDSIDQWFSTTGPR